MPETVDMTVNETLLALSSVREAQYLAQAREAELLAHYADLCSHLDAEWNHGRVLAGERLVQVGSDGAPEIAEFATLEVAAIWNENAGTTTRRIGVALDLRHRFPRLWELMQLGELAPWVATRVSEIGRNLTLPAARELDVQTADAVETGLPTGRLLQLVEGLVLQLTPADELANQRAVETPKVVVTHRRRLGVATGRSIVFARMSSVDAEHLDLTIRQLAHILKQGGDTGELDQRRARALGVLAHPAYALQLLQASLIDQPLPTDQALPTDQVEAEAGVCPAQGRPGHVCGTITVDPDRLLPKAQIVLHLSDAALIGATITSQEEALADHLTDGSIAAGSAPINDPQEPVADNGRQGSASSAHIVNGIAALSTGADATRPTNVCRVERIGPVATQWLGDLFGNHRLTIRPILDTATIRPVDSYEIPARMRRAVVERNPYDIFPGSTIRSRDCDLDHTDPYRWDGPPGQTRPDNLAPLSRRAHRAKTFGHWHATQIHPGVVVWKAPHGHLYLATPNGTITIASPPGARLREASAA